MSASRPTLDFSSKFSELRTTSADALEGLAKRRLKSSPLGEACLYSLLPPGKCLRAVLALAAGELLGIPSRTQLPFAVAVEMIHAATLVHDDLPAMDDDALRRGRPSSHVRFGEATAILVGDRLIATAFEVLSTEGDNDCEVRARQTALLAEATSNVCDGQLMDLLASGKAPNGGVPVLSPEDELLIRHQNKTAALIRAAVLSAVQFLPRDEASEAENHLLEYGSHLGLLFQITDDILEATSSTEIIGKDATSDKRQGLPTYITVFGLEEARALAKQSANRARTALIPFAASADFLYRLVEFVLERER